MIQSKVKKNKREKKIEKAAMSFIYIILAFAVIVLAFTTRSIFFSDSSDQTYHTSNVNVPTMSRMSFTSFDRELAKKFMDKNNDGKCDSCGMPVEMCMDSGQLECNMDSQSTIGVLESQHIHADWKIYINGQLLDFNGMDHMTRMRSGASVSSFIHVDSGAPAPEKTGDILHMHATGVPLWIFFESIELELPDGVKAYANGKEISDFKNYVFNNLDKILITDSDGDLQKQLDSITDFAKKH